MHYDLSPRQFRLGAATVTIITSGVGRWRVVDELVPPAGGWRTAELARLRETTFVPFQSVHIALGSAVVVVDAMDFAVFITRLGGTVPEWQRDTPRLDAQLASLGIAPEGVTHLVITHAHDDHYNVATVADEATGQRRLLFPNATHIAERADWTPAGQRTVFDALPAGERLPGFADEIMGEVFRQGRMHLVSGDYDIAEGIRLIPTPGETPGHAAVRIQSEGQTLYCLGDLFHDAIEIEHPDAMPTWADPEPTCASRQALLAAAQSENALLIASHIPGVGRVHAASEGGVTWTPVAIGVVA